MSEIPFAFVVEPHEYMFACIPGKVPGTVLTIEAQIYTWRICEYTEPLFIGRSWCYENLGVALGALMNYVTVEVATEPQGWKRAIDFENGYRIRRARVEFGERVIVVDGEDGL